MKYCQYLITLHFVRRARASTHRPNSNPCCICFPIERICHSEFKMTYNYVLAPQQCDNSGGHVQLWPLLYVVTADGLKQVEVKHIVSQPYSDHFLSHPAARPPRTKTPRSPFDGYTISPTEPNPPYPAPAGYILWPLRGRYMTRPGLGQAPARVLFPTDQCQ